MSDKLKFLEGLLGSSRYSHSTQEAEFSCPFDGCPSVAKGKKKLSVNLETDNFKCWVCDNKGRNLFRLISKVGSRDDLETYNKYYKAKSVVQKTISNIQFKPSLPKEYRALSECENSMLGRRCVLYLKNRGIEKQDILRYKIGVLIDGEHSGRVVFPSFSASGKLNFYTTRTTDERGNYRDDPHTPREYKTQIVLNELNIDWKKPITIVEGFVDMMKCGDNCVPLFGSSLRKGTKLFEEIAMNNVPVFLALDPDANKKMLHIAKMFLEYDIPVYKIEVSPYKDVGEMSKQEFARRYKEAKIISEESIIRERIRSLA